MGNFTETIFWKETYCNVLFGYHLGSLFKDDSGIEQFQELSKGSSAFLKKYFIDFG